MIVAELRIVPVGDGSSMEKALERAVRVVKDSGLKHEVGPMGTIIEGEEMRAVLGVVQRAHEAVAQDVPRVLTEVSIDHRMDKPEDMASLRQVQV